MKVRKHCCSPRLTPQVASSVSSGRLYRWRISAHSMIQPKTKATPKASTIATGK